MGARLHWRVVVASVRSLVVAAIVALAIACGSRSGGGPTADPVAGSPPAPTRVSATAGDGQVTIQWRAVNGASSYTVTLSPLPCVTKTDSGLLSAWKRYPQASSPLTVTELTNGQPYYLVVSAVNAKGEGAASAEVSATPGTGTPSRKYFKPSGCMTVPHASHTATLLPNETVLMAGGFLIAGDVDGSAPARAELYEVATGTFVPTGTLVTARTRHTATLLGNGNVLLAGGSGTDQALSAAELYDPSTGTFTATGSLAIPRYFHTATALQNGTVLIAGGFGHSTPNTTEALAEAELYDPETGTFRATGRMAAPRLGHTATRLPDGKVLIAGGFGDAGGLASAEIYDPATGVFSSAGDMSEPRDDHTATSLADGRVLIIGGDGVGGVLASAELYDPSIHSFRSVGSLAGPRTHHTATLLDDGRVLVVGGSGGGPLIAERYDPTTEAFSALEAPIVQRYDHTATALPDGTVLIAGGLQPVTLASAELYATGTDVPPPDATAPVFFDVTVESVSATGATITWATNEAADSQVEYGTTTEYGSSTTPDKALVTGHRVTLGGLTTSALYHYRVKSRDAAGNVATSEDFTVTPMTVVRPVVTGLATSSRIYGVSPSQSVTIMGTNFVLGATITVGSLSGVTVAGITAGATTPFVFVSSRQIRFWWPNTALAPGAYAVEVTNPADVGGASGSLANGWTVTAPQPTVTSRVTSSLIYGISPSQSVTIMGTNFVLGATIMVGSLSGTTVNGTTAGETTPFVFVSATKVRLWWPNTALAPGAYTVEVTNPTDAGGLSGSLADGWAVTAPQPTVTSASPNPVTGAAGRSITIYGTNFVLGATITVGSLSGVTVAGSAAGAATPFVFASNSQVRFWWSNSLLPIGSYTVTVTNPTAAGGLAGSLATGFVVQ